MSFGQACRGTLSGGGGESLSEGGHGNISGGGMSKMGRIRSQLGSVLPMIPLLTLVN